jgi:hypothetical protein
MNTTTRQSGISLNWGHGILGVLLLFLVGMCFMLYIASRQTNEMVDDHYYQKELAYQGVIDAGKNLEALTGQSIVSQTPEHVLIQFPVGSFENLESGTIDLQRGDASRKDLHFELSTTGTATFEIPKSGMTRGYYRIKVAWINRQVPYYFEENVFIEK